jgi:hypothetical protein
MSSLVPFLILKNLLHPFELFVAGFANFLTNNPYYQMISKYFEQIEGLSSRIPSSQDLYCIISNHMKLAFTNFQVLHTRIYSCLYLEIFKRILRIY